MDKIILHYLNSNDIFYQVVEHDPIFTMEESKTIAGFSLKQGLKSLLLKADKNDFILLVLPGHKKLDSKKAKQILHAKDLRFATPEEVKKIMHCEIGSCFPFGNLIPIQMIVDESLLKNKFVTFTPGVHHKTIKMHWKDYYKIIQPSMKNIAQ